MQSLAELSFESSVDGPDIDVPDILDNPKGIAIIMVETMKAVLITSRGGCLVRL